MQRFILLVCLLLISTSCVWGDIVGPPLCVGRGSCDYGYMQISLVVTM